MADNFQFTLKGVEELNKKLANISKDMKLKGGRFALRKAANVVADRVKQNAAALDDPETAESIFKNVAVRWAPKHFRATGDLKFRVGIMGGAGGNKTSEQLSGLPGLDTRHWRHKEFGAEKMPAQPFMRRALPETAEKAADTFIAQYKKSIDRALKKL